MEYPMRKLIPSNFFYERYPNVLVFQLGDKVKVGFKFYKDTQDSMVIFTFDAALKDIIMTIPEGMELSLGATLDMANEAERQIKCGNLGSMSMEMLAAFFSQVRNYRNGKMEEGVEYSIVGILSEMVNSENDVGYAITQYQKLKERFEYEVNGKRFKRTPQWSLSYDNAYTVHPVSAMNPYVEDDGWTAASYPGTGRQVIGIRAPAPRAEAMAADDGALRVRTTALFEEQLAADRLRILAGMMEDLGPTHIVTNPNQIGVDWAEQIDNLPVEELPVENLPVQELPEGIVMEQYLEDVEPFNVAMPHDDIPTAEFLEGED